MHTVADIQAAITLLRLHNPDALRLGELVSLAARIEPELLRAVRLELTTYDAAAEADLWFSPLVETRTADWIALVPVAARELRSALVTDHSSLTAAHELITKAHSSAPATIILEEEIIWLALSGGAEAAEAIESRLRLVLGKLLEDPRAHKGLAHWFAGAAQRLPEQAQATEAYALLYFVTSGLLDGRRINAPQPTLSSIDALAGTWPASIPKLPLWATLNDYGLTLRPEKVPGFVPLEVPRTEPLLLELRTPYEQQFITVRRGETKTFQIRSREVELHTAAGDTYRLRRPHKRSSGVRQNLVMGFGGTGAHILTALKELTVLKHGRMPENLRFLLFDTIADWQPGKRVQTMGESIEEEIALGDERITSLDPQTEYFHLADFDPDLKRHVYDYLSLGGKPDEFPHLKYWLHAQWFSQYVPMSRLDISGGAAQQRQIGRFAMFQNANKIIQRLRSLVRSLAERAGEAEVNIWIICSSAGGTGAGCFLDAAYMMRLAAADFNYSLMRGNYRLMGVIVLPDVYESVAGISKARAYSLLRELDRVQEQGIPQSDRYEDAARRGDAQISSKVHYDAHDKLVARVKAKLFDDLFYIGEVCSIENQRKNFFTSVANAMVPYLDTNSGPWLLETSVNYDAAASSFGAARLYVPVETLTDIFAWEQVEEYLRGVAAPSERGGRVINVYSGSANDRHRSARSKVENLLALFGEILQRVDWADNQKEKWARSQSFDAEMIITGWYQFAGAAIADERLTPPEAQVIQTTYLNPFISLIHTGKVPPQDLETNTYKENRAVKGVKESQEESRDRFANRLEAIITRYTSAGGGERTFEKGRRLVFEKVSNRLRNRVDSLVIDELQRNAAFTTDALTPEDGTTLTRLFEELRLINSDDGPLRKIYATIGKFLDALMFEEDNRQQQPVNALHNLRTSERTGFISFSVWVEPYQQMAREECAEYIHWYQKRALLKDMQRIVRSVADRFLVWERTIGKVLDNLVLREGESAFFKVRKVYLQQLEDRLLRATSNATALMGISNNKEMDGYRDRLREQSTYVFNNLTLAANALANSRWEPGVAANGSPELHLLLDHEITLSYNGDTIRNLPQDLYNYFHKEIDRVLQTTDIFDYLLYMREKHKLEPGHIAELLNKVAKPLINAEAAPEEGQLVYREPFSKEKINLAIQIQKELMERNGSVRDPQRTHSDQNSIYMVKIKKPSSVSQILNLEECRRDYVDWLTVDHSKLRGDIQSENNLYRAQVHHVFRQELEAWFIERNYWSARQERPKDLLWPRIVRLLEHPDMLHAFVQCLATVAVERIGPDWVWHSRHGDVKLTDSMHDGKADIIRAAIVFALQQREVGPSTKTISLTEARQSAIESAQKKGKTLDDMLNEFKSQLDEFLAKHLDIRRTGEEQDLKIVLEFYCDPKRRTSLEYRLNL